MNFTLSRKYIHVFCWKSPILFSSKRFLDGNAYLWHNCNRKLSMFKGNKTHFIVFRDSFFKIGNSVSEKKMCKYSSHQNDFKITPFILGNES